MANEHATTKKSDRNQRRTVIGVVTSAKMNKTRRVEIQRLVKHPRYGKYIRQRTICYVHDENNESGIGDTVEIEETRPLSKMKNWRLVRIVTRSPQRSEHVSSPATSPETGQAQ